MTYQNFGRGDYGSAECGAANMADTNWLVSHCESELDWICKIPKGKVEEEPESHEGLPQGTLFCLCEYKTVILSKEKASQVCL